MSKMSEIDKVLANLREEVTVINHSIAFIEAARVIKRPTPIAKREKRTKKDEAPA